MSTSPESAAETPMTSKQLAKEIERLKRLYQTTAFAEFKAGFRALFDQYPRLQTVRWHASYEYNDEGGTDLSSAHEEPHINGFDEYGDVPDYEDEGENLLDASEANDDRPADKEAKAIVKAVRALTGSFEHVFYEQHFAEGGNVIRKGSGIAISE